MANCIVGDIVWYSLNPYFIGLPILIMEIFNSEVNRLDGLNPYFIGLPILMPESSSASTCHY